MWRWPANHLERAACLKGSHQPRSWRCWSKCVPASQPLCRLSWPIRISILSVNEGSRKCKIETMNKKKTILFPSVAQCSLIFLYFQNHWQWTNMIPLPTPYHAPTTYCRIQLPKRLSSYSSDSLINSFPNNPTHRSPTEECGHESGEQNSLKSALKKCDCVTKSSTREDQNLTKECLFPLNYLTLSHICYYCISDEKIKWYDRCNISYVYLADTAHFTLCLFMCVKDPFVALVDVEIEKKKKWFPLTVNLYPLIGVFARWKANRLWNVLKRNRAAPRQVEGEVR